MSEGTVRGWKNKDKWDEQISKLQESSTPESTDVTEELYALAQKRLVSVRSGQGIGKKALESWTII
ncbi:hypothetical protein [Brevibacillus porteri]|uniref:Uncharacterized protein n=1 Tax=Brevibacillus porteri TaxID=2126350 RepID=A0ABX5FXB4_9BACL|nr:hypothetical protein C7R92_00520 [Brevibacillus porteri]